MIHRYLSIVLPTLLSLLASCSEQNYVAQDAKVLQRCMAVPADKVRNIAKGLTFVDASLRINSAQAVRSKAFKKLYFIATDVQGPGMEGPGEIGVWASNSLDPSDGIILSVSPIASTISDWPKGKSTKVKVSMWDDGATESVNCVRAKLRK